MSPDEASQIYQQHATIMVEIQNVYVALAIACFVGLAFLLAMFGAAAWSVRSVNLRTAGLDAKFSLLIDILLKQAEREIAAQRVQIDAESVEVHES